MIQNKKTRNGIILILFIQFLFSLEMSIIYPLTPQISKIYGVQAHQFTYMNLGNAVLGLFSPLIGYASDKTGIKNMLGFSLLLFALGTFLVGINPGSIPFYVLGRSLSGLAFFTLMGLGINYLSLLVNKSKLGVYSGLYKIAFVLGVFASPFMGLFFLKHLSFQGIYFGLSALTLLLFITFMLSTPFITTSQEPISFDAVLSLIKGTNERRMILITFLMSSPAIFFFNYLSIYLDTRGISANTIGSLYTVVAFGSFLGGLFIMLKSDKIGKLRSLVLASSFIPLFLIGIYYTNGLLLFGFGLGFGFFFDSTAGLLIPVGSELIDKHHGTYLTILSLTMSLMNVFSNLIAPSLYDLGGFVLLVSIMVISIFSGNLILRTVQGGHDEIS